MTKEEAKQLLPIMQSFVEGKVIQYKDWDMMNNTFEWKDLKKGEEWDWHGEYRIKPEPTCRPFKDAEECWNEMQKHQPFGWVKNKVNGYQMITDLCDITDEKFLNLSIGEMDISAENTLEVYTFADGEPFGVKEESI